MRNYTIEAESKPIVQVEGHNSKGRFLDTLTFGNSEHNTKATYQAEDSIQARKMFWNDHSGNIWTIKNCYIDE